MKALILILLLGVAAQAQTIADLARQQRARQQARSQGSRVITNEDLKRSQILTAGTETQQVPQTGDKPAAPAKTTEQEKPADTAQAAAKPDPVQAWNEELDLLRKQIRELQDKETATLLQINDLTNKVYAPVTTVKAREEAQAALGAAQKNLVKIREEIVATRLKLEQLQTRGPARN